MRLQLLNTRCDPASVSLANPRSAGCSDGKAVPCWSYEVLHNLPQCREVISLMCLSHQVTSTAGL